MARKRINRTGESANRPGETQTGSASFLSPLETILNRFFRKKSDEVSANLNDIEWLIYIGMLLSILIMPFLFSRATTENFLTPKEFFSKIAFAVLGGAYCAQLFMRRKIMLAKTSLDFPLAIFFGFAAFSVLWNYNAPSAIRDLRGVFSIMLLYPLVVNVVRSRWQLELILWTVIFTGLATSFIGILETYNFYFKFNFSSSAEPFIKYVKDDVLQGKIFPDAFYLPLFPQLATPEYGMGSVVSTFGNRNYLGTFAMFTAFLPLAFVFYYRNIAMKVLSFGLFSWMLYGLYITRCRAALIGIAIGIVFMVIMIFINYKKRKLFSKNFLLFVVAVGLIFSALFWISVNTIKSESILDKIKYTFTLDRKISNTYERMWVWHGTIEAFNKTPFAWFFGRGFGSFKHFFPYQEADTFSDNNKETFTPVTFRQAHNDWLQLISEMGLLGLAMFLFIVHRYFSCIQNTLRREIHATPNGEMNGDHVLLIGVGAAMVAQLLASVPDFPFHRIETAVYAILFLGLVPVLAETNFFAKQIERKQLQFNSVVALSFTLVAVAATVGAVYYEQRCWKADEMVRSADLYVRHKDPRVAAMAKSLLLQAVQLDPLPGDPYLKLASIFENEKDGERALIYANKALRNINFNARSTYHSVVFRKLHIYYHLLNKLPEAYQMALEGVDLTAGEARSLFYMYGGKIALDITRYAIPEDRRNELLQKAEVFLTRAMKSQGFDLQARASLAVIMAGRQRWQEARDYAASVSALVADRDPAMLNILGISSSNLGDHAAAEVALKKALELYPDNMVYKRDLGVVYLRANRLDKARTFLEDAAMANSSPPEIKQHANSLIASITEAEFNMANALIQAGRTSDAMLVLQQLYSARVINQDTKNWAGEQIVKLNRLPAEKNDYNSIDSIPVSVPASAIPQVYQIPENSEN